MIEYSDAAYYEEKELLAGDVVRMFDGAFGDAVVLGFTRYDGGDWYASLARPYLYASNTETCCPSPLLGYEKIDMVSLKLLAGYPQISAGRTT